MNENNWISVKDRFPNVKSGKFRVRKANGNEMDAFFYEDKISWIAFYGLKTSYWWDAKGNNDRLDNVTHWFENTKP